MTQRNALLAAVLAAVAGAAAFYFLALSPKREEITRLDGEIKTQQTARDQANAQAAAYEQAKASYRANYAKVVQLGKAVPADDDVRSLLVRLEDTARRDDIDFRLIKVGEGAGSGTESEATAPVIPGVKPLTAAGVGVLPFAFRFNGGYFELADFMTKVDEYVDVQNRGTDTSGRLMMITSFSLRPEPVLGFPHLQAEIGAASFVAQPPAPPAPQQSAAASGGSTPAPSSDGAAPTTTATATGAVR